MSRSRVYFYHNGKEIAVGGMWVGTDRMARNKAGEFIKNTHIGVMVRGGELGDWETLPNGETSKLTKVVKRKHFAVEGTVRIKMWHPNGTEWATLRDDE